MEHNLDVLYRQLSMKHRVVVQKYLDVLDLYIGQPRFLFEISKRPGISQAELAKNLILSKETVSVSLKRLEAGGFILRENSKVDGRIKLLYLSDKGLSVVEELKVNFDKINNSMFSKLNEDDKNRLEVLFEAMIAGLEEGVEGL